VTGTGRVQAAAALATLLVVTSLSSLVSGVTWYLEAVVVVLAVTGAGAAARRLSRVPLVAVAAQAVALLVVLTWLYARPQAALGLVPDLSSTSRLLQVAVDGLTITRDVAPPAPPEAGVRLLVTAGAGAVAVLVDLLAVGLRQPAVAGLPLLAVYCVPAALAQGGLDWYWFALAAGGFLLLVASDSGERLSRWGRILHGQGGDAAPMAATGRRVGALALVSALIVPTVVPGLDEGLFFGRGTGDGPGAGGKIQYVNPIFNLRDNLTTSRNDPVLSYETTGTPQPLRIVTVDSFDGSTWSPTPGTVPRSQTANGALPAPPGLAGNVLAPEQRYRITIDNLSQVWLPVPYPPSRIDILGPWLYDDVLNIIGDGVTTERGLSYDVRYLDVSPTPEQLLAAPAPPPELVAEYGQLPDTVSPQVVDLAAEVAGEGTAYERAVRLQTFFRSGGGFQYSPQAPDGNSPSAIDDFLQRRSGYCVHFASAMAVMARSLGIPARVAIGFLPGTPQPDGSFQVGLRDAHAWPELFFSGVGWVRFEPTPATRTGSLPSWAAPPPDLTGAQEPTDAPTAATQAPDGGTSASTSRDRAAQDQRSVVEVLAAVPWRGVGAVTLVLAVLAAPLVTALVVHRVRWRRAAVATDRASATAEAAWTTLAERVRDLGRPLPPAATPRQAEAQLADGLSERGRAALHRVTRAVERARYAPHPAAAEHLRSDVAAVVHAVAVTRPRVDRWRARLVPVSGLEHLRSAVVEAGLALDAAERRLVARVRDRLRAAGGRVSASGRRDAGPSAPRGAA
jgi:transglutaminase-like putative cysteine protease